jgi:hypothetical protein
LQHQLQIEGELQLADDDERSAVRAERDQIAMADLSLDGKAKAFEETFDGKVERGFQTKISGATGEWVQTQTL